MLYSAGFDSDPVFQMLDLCLERNNENTNKLCFISQVEQYYSI